MYCIEHTSLPMYYRRNLRHGRGNRRAQNSQDAKAYGEIKHTRCCICRAHVLPDADEEHASLVMVNKWVELADAALMEKKERKRA